MSNDFEQRDSSDRYDNENRERRKDGGLGGALEGAARKAFGGNNDPNQQDGFLGQGGSDPNQQGGYGGQGYNDPNNQYGNQQQGGYNDPNNQYGNQQQGGYNDPNNQYGNQQGGSSEKRERKHHNRDEYSDNQSSSDNTQDSF